MKNEFKPEEVVKSDGPLRKLRILSDHWIAKVMETGEKSSPSSAVDISVDHVIDTTPRSRLSSPKLNTPRLTPGLHHSYIPPTMKSAHLLPVKERKSRHTYSTTQGGGFNTQRSRYVQNKVGK